jgi:ferredoxin-NADP reductase
MSNLLQQKHTIRSVDFLNDTLFELTVDRLDIPFEAGDCMAIYSPDGKSRPYSIASGTTEDELRFLIRKLPYGEVTTQLANTKKGDVLKISPPFGWFRPGQEKQHAPSVFFATGTGIAPFISYLLSSPKQQPLAIYYGIAQQTDLNHLSLLKNTDQLYVAISQEDSAYHRGRITDLLENVPLDPMIHYYCCGREKMINEISEWLTNKNIPLSSIHREVFFHG